MSNTPPIPDVPDNILPAVSALANAAVMLRGIISTAFREDRPIKEVCIEHMESLLMCDQVCDAWAQKLGLEE